MFTRLRCVPKLIFVQKLDEIDCWILIELSDTCQNVNVALEELNFSGAVQQLQDFFISSFCDVYIELCKPDLKSGEKRSNKEFVLWFCLNIYLRLLHPFAPFVTDVSLNHCIFWVLKSNICMLDRNFGR